MEQIKAPFTENQISKIKEYQKLGICSHPFTCGGIYCDRSKRPDEGILMPTKDGLECPCGRYKQNWVYKFMQE